MKQFCNTDLSVVRRNKFGLMSAIENNRAGKWILCLWSRFIRARDAHRCLCCHSRNGIQAHHIIRKVLYPWGAFDTGNGITLCRECHKSIHAEFNGRPNLSLPLDAEHGDDQDEWAFLFGLLLQDAEQRKLNEDEFYYINDNMLQFFVNCQGYHLLHEMVLRGEMSRIRFAHEVWRWMPQIFYTNFVTKLAQLNL